MGDSTPSSNSHEADGGHPRPGDRARTTPAVAAPPWLESPQWTDVLPKTEHTAFFLNTAWNKTSLGPLSSWGPALRFAVSMVLADSRASCVYWGPTRIAIYNEKFKIVAAKAHPRLMGIPFSAGFAELEKDVSQVFAHVEATGSTMDVQDLELYTYREDFGFFEETYFIGQFIPFRGDDGRVQGIYNTTFENTQHVCFERFRQLNNSIAALQPGPVDQTASRIVDAMRSNPRDIPMAILYSCEELNDSDTKVLHLRNSIGIPDGHPSVCDTINLSTGRGALARLYGDALDAGNSIILDYKDRRLFDNEAHSFDGVQWSGFEEPSHQIIVTPLLDSAKSPLGLLVHGTNPRRPFDVNVRMSIAEMTLSIESKWMASISSDQAKLRELLLENKLTYSERRLRHMAQAAPFGMIQVGPEGRIEFANKQYYEITGTPETQSPHIEDFLKVLHPDDIAAAGGELTSLFVGPGTSITHELRLLKPWSPPVPAGQTDPIAPVNGWILATGVALIEDGQVKSVMGFITEISQLKFAESVQSRNAEAATLAKAQQELFIDTTSHEMRNPLMAMTQLADGIIKSLEDVNSRGGTLEKYKDIVKSKRRRRRHHSCLCHAPKKNY